MPNSSETGRRILRNFLIMDLERGTHATTPLPLLRITGISEVTILHDLKNKAARLRTVLRSAHGWRKPDGRKWGGLLDYAGRPLIKADRPSEGE